MFVFFSRNGAPLGTLDLEADGIYLMKSEDPRSIPREDREKMECGHYISSNKDPITGDCICAYCTGRYRTVRFKLWRAMTTISKLLGLWE